MPSWIKYYLVAYFTVMILAVIGFVYLMKYLIGVFY